MILKKKKSMYAEIQSAKLQISHHSAIGLVSILRGKQYFFYFLFFLI
jgi:hypothetical protein